MKKKYPTVFHSSVESLPYIIVSAGKIGYQVELSPERLMAEVGASIADLIEERREEDGK